MKITNKQLRQLAKVTVLGVAMTVAVSAQAAITTAYTSNIATGSQVWTGPLGMDFHVISPIQVLSLGVFDSGGVPLNPTTTLIAELWSLNVAGDTGVLLTSMSFTSASPGLPNDFSLFKSISPLTLGIGDYTIVATGFNGVYSNGNSGLGDLPSSFNGGSLITDIGSARYGDSGLSNGGNFPNHVDGGPATRYTAGTFTFEAASVPARVPSTLVLATMGIFGMGWLLRRQVVANRT